jgi:electron transfer flavoprotein alpha subunit
MRATIFFTKYSGFQDGYGFLTLIGEILGTNIDITAITPLKKNEVEKDGIKGVEKIYLLNGDTTESYARAILKLWDDINPDIFISSSDKNGIDILTRISVDKDIPMVTEIVEVDKEGDNIILRRPIIGGRALAEYEFKTPLIATVATGKFKAVPKEKTPTFIEVDKEESGIKLREVLPKEKGAVDLEIAEVVVGVGRGFKEKDDLKLAYELAELIGGEIGCSRPIAADFQWLSEDRWIGISGKKIRGKLYIAIGISGAPQHIMAASDSKIIVAVNKDKSAPIFTYADYGVVADLYQFLPSLIKALKERLK